MAVKKILQLVYRGSAFKMGDPEDGPKRTLFEKDVLTVGEWFHPINGERIEFDHDRLVALATATNHWIQDVGNEVTFPKNHTTDPLGNLGIWHPPFRVVGDRLMGVVEVLDEEAIEKVQNQTLRGVSVFIEFNVLGQDGRLIPEVITHVAATNDPVITGQEDFVPLARKAHETGAELFLSSELATGGEEAMTPEQLKKLAVLMGLPETATPEEILAKAEELSEAGETETEEVANALREEGFKYEGGKLVKLSFDPEPQQGDTPEMASMKEELSRVRQRQELGSATASLAFVEKLIGEGKIPPALKNEVLELASLSGKAEAILLGRTAGDVERIQVDLSAALRGLLDKLPTLTGSLSRSGGGSLQSSADSEVLNKRGEGIAKRHLARVATDES
ncbi:MAG: phage protease [Candidatus Thermoplasmatota archaeon]|nr:phage protease [Candidatus Thermoplasmatota archaeon]